MLRSTTSYSHPLLRMSVLAVIVITSAVAGATIYRKFSHYLSAPGAPALAENQWPKQSQLKLDPERDTLLVFLHPKCPCSRATLQELNRVLPYIKERTSISVIFDQPDGQEKSWHLGQNWETAGKLPFVNRFVDDKSVELKRFGVKTSGQALLYSKEGNLLFAGGLTPARGHGGDSLGRASLIERSKTGRIPAAQSNVFGCAMERSKI